MFFTLMKLYFKNNIISCNTVIGKIQRKKFEIACAIRRRMIIRANELRRCTRVLVRVIKKYTCI